MDPRLFDIPADLDTPVSAFLKLEPFQPRFLLESVVGGERQARYSFLGFGDAFELSLDGEDLRMGDAVEPVPTDPEQVLAHLRAALESAPMPGRNFEQVPFRGGLVGAAGFDLVRRLQRLPRQPALGGADQEAAYVAPRSILVFDHASRRVALMHDGSESETAALKKELRRALRAQLPRPRGAASLQPAATSMGRDRYMDGVLRTKEAIAEGEVYQLVLSECFSGESDLDPFEAYRALRLLNPSPYMFFLRLGESTVVGSSPEVLVKLEGRQATLRPIAGTRPRAADPQADQELEEELLADPKEAAEHVMLVDLARNDLGRVALPGTVKVNPYRSVERYSHVMHIVSGVEGVLRAEGDQFDLYAAAFPAGTVVGAPKVRAMELIAELEPQRRGFYGGTVGYFGHGGSMDQAIAIRTMVFKDGRYSYQAGAGIVADSDPAKEYAEVEAKGAALGAALDMAKEGL
ncbi:MAG: anthranilate synthase component I family protein [Planctomycetota bacterium]|jgi:anthranilate synthase component 1